LSGTCCIAVLQIDNLLYTCNVGDSRAVLCTSRNLGHTKKAELCAYELSTDHKPNRQIEKDRILKAGGKIERDEKSLGPYRIWADEEGPGLAVARTLGDLCGHKIGISSEPEIEVWPIEATDVFVVLGSDGVWDVVSSAEAVGFISK
jgi:integrin-linked kinase-associated serine/threonine phosphatase 2C